MHSYLLPGRPWKASGSYYDENGRAFELIGQSQATQTGGEWVLNASMEVLFETPVRFSNRYSIHLTDAEHTLSWTSFNPALGQLSGTFSIIGNSIISIYSSENGTYSGSETLMQIDPTTYHNVGVAFHNGVRMSAWTALLKSEQPSV